MIDLIRLKRIENEANQLTKAVNQMARQVEKKQARMQELQAEARAIGAKYGVQLGE